MEVKGRNLESECIRASFDCGVIRFVCHSGNMSDPMSILILDGSDPQYLEAMKWYLEKGVNLNGSND